MKCLFKSAMSVACHVLPYASTLPALSKGESCAQVLLSPEMGSRTVHFDALRREVQLAARFNSERLVQVDSVFLFRFACRLLMKPS